MSATAAPLPAPVGAAPDRSTPPSLTRLTAVELRKMVNTRANFWLLVTVVLATLAIVVAVAIAGDASDHTLPTLLSAAIAPASLLLPVVGILLASSEWSQRTALVTFALIPQRSRLVAAKLLAGVALALAALVLGVVVAAIGTAVAGSGVDGRWSLSLALLGQDAVVLTSAMAIGIGFGAALQASAPAIVLYYLLPAVFGALGSIAVLDGAAEWLDTSRSMDQLTERLLSATEWAQVATTLLLWMALPLAAGTWRTVRGEIR